LNTILVTYDLRGRDEASADYARLINEVKAYGQVNVIHPLYSVWLIRTEWTASQVRDDLQRWVDSSDRLLVWSVTDRAAAWSNLSPSDSTWIRDTP
jgi:hypothetical protein